MHTLRKKATRIYWKFNFLPRQCTCSPCPGHTADHSNPAWSRSTQWSTIFAWSFPVWLRLDSALIPRLKKELRGRRFDNLDELRGATQCKLSSFSQEWYASTFKDWVRRHEKCVRVKGEYFETVTYITFYDSITSFVTSWAAPRFVMSMYINWYRIVNSCTIFTIFWEFAVKRY
jgi:hypothetical protein